MRYQYLSQRRDCRPPIYWMFSVWGQSPRDTECSPSVRMGRSRVRETEAVWTLHVFSVRKEKGPAGEQAPPLSIHRTAFPFVSEPLIKRDRILGCCQTTLPGCLRSASHAVTVSLNATRFSLSRLHVRPSRDFYCYSNVAIVHNHWDCELPSSIMLYIYPPILHTDRYNT